jgi:ribose 5-phosphate isomerase B
MTIYIGSDHAGFKLKESMKKFLTGIGVDFEDTGNKKYDKNDDYPVFAAKLARKVANSGSLGVLFCGSSFGMCIAANKIKGIRAVSVNNVADAKLARLHNDANVLCLSGGGTLDKLSPGLKPEFAKKIIKAFLFTLFSKEERHKRRINEIKRLE